MEALSNVTPVNNCTAPTEPGEEWRLIVDPEVRADMYEVSNLGRVRNIKDNTLVNLRLETSGRYLYVQLSGLAPCSAVSRSVHRLVAKAFLPPPAEGQIQVDHIDSDSFNNKASNLRWCTRLENAHNPNTLEKHKGTPDKIRPYMQTRVYCEDIDKTFGSMAEAAAFFGIDDEVVRKICNLVDAGGDPKKRRVDGCHISFKRLPPLVEYKTPVPVLPDLSKSPKGGRQKNAIYVRCEETGIISASAAEAARVHGLAHKTVRQSMDGAERCVAQYSKPDRPTYHFVRATREEYVEYVTEQLALLNAKEQKEALEG